MLHYGNLPQEAPAHTKEDPPASWPSQGGIQFEDVQMMYRPGLPPVLKGVTFDVKPGEKVRLLPWISLRYRTNSSPRSALSVGLVLVCVQLPVSFPRVCFDIVTALVGKSSLLQALFRTVEIHSGKIEIDSVNISKIGMDVLRTQLAIIPQDVKLL